MINNYGVTMVPVSSSNVQSIGYDENTMALYVNFLNNALYIYKNVPKLEYDELLRAPSIGSYLHRNIKAQYPYERIE